MGHVEKHHRFPCDRCAHPYSKHRGKPARCTVAGCTCTGWKSRPGDRETYRARWIDPAGKERAKTFTRKVDAEQHLVSVEDAKLRGAYVDPRAGRLAFGEWAERWYVTTRHLKPKTRRDYRDLLDNQVLPTFAAAALANIDTMMIREWVAGLVERGLSASRTRNAHNVLSQVLGSAVEAGRIARNPAARMRLPRIVRREMHFLSAAQVEALATAIDPRYTTLVRFAAYTGLRAGELFALRVRRLNLLRGTCEVVDAAAEVGGKMVLGATKTYERRIVRLPRFLCTEVAAYLADRPHQPGDLVFTAPMGGMLRPTTFLERYFRPGVARANRDRQVLPERLRLHDLRHTCASLLIAQHASVKAVQAQLGHASATMTLDRYGHLFPDEMEHLAERLDRAHADALTDRARTG